MTSLLLPPATTGLEHALEETTAHISDVPHPLDTLWSPEECPAQFLPWLAWALSVDDWKPEWPEQIQRQVIAAALKVHRYKGTLGAVRLAVEALGYDDCGVSEWFEQEPKDAPYTFRISLDVIQQGLKEGDWETLRAVIWNAKNLRSHMAGIQLTLKRQNKIPFLATALIPGNTTTVYPSLLRERTMRSPHRFGLALHAGVTVLIRPLPIGDVHIDSRLSHGWGLHLSSSTTVYPEHP